MAYARKRRSTRRVSRRPRQSFRRKRTFRKRSKYSRRRVTGIPNRKFIKVRKDVMYTVGSSTSNSWNAIIACSAQVANAAQMGFWYGNSVTAIDSIVDQNSYTGMNEWFAFYNKYIVCGSKIKVTMQARQETLLATLVPTVDWNLANQGSAGTTTFDAGLVEPGELPYAKRCVMPYSLAGGENRTLQSYCSVKKMLGVKDLSDVAWDDGADFNPKPFVPQVTSAATAATGIQPLTGSGQNGLYWNLVLQNMDQNQAVVPGTAVSPAFNIRVTITSYLMFTERKVLATTG